MFSSPPRKRRYGNTEINLRETIEKYRETIDSIEIITRQQMDNLCSERDETRKTYNDAMEDIENRKRKMKSLVIKKTGEVLLNVGGKSFKCDREVLSSVDCTLFSTILEHPDSSYSVDRDPAYFSIILKYLHSCFDGSVFSLKGLSKAALTSIIVESEFYSLPGLRRLAINCTAIVVSQDVGSPYSTISSAIASAVDGDTIIVLPGRYEESIFTTKHIELIGDGPIEDIILCSTDDHPFIVYSGSGGGVLRGLTLRETSPFGVCLVEVKGNSSVMIDNCDLSTTQSSNAVNVLNSSSLYLVNSHVHDVKGSAVFLRDSSTATIRNNKFVNLESCGLFTRHNTRFFLFQNIVKNASLGGVDINDHSLGTIESNIITECGRGGLVFYGTSHTRIKGNTIKNNEYGMRSFEESQVILTANIVENNTIKDLQGTALRKAKTDEANNQNLFAALVDLGSENSRQQ